ncbi:hypothetical protein SMZ18_000779 [Cronobacter dublinensis]|nr:hypothetical protein [Cronobacter dublinensis]
MAIHAKSNGWLISGNVLKESDTSWVFQAMDEKRPKVIAKNDPNNQVFDGEDAVAEASAWQDKTRKARSNS